MIDAEYREEVRKIVIQLQVAWNKFNRVIEEREIDEAIYQLKFLDMQLNNLIKGGMTNVKQTSVVSMY